jgi:hypothetical protein
MISPGIETATFRLVTQCLNQLTTDENKNPYSRTATQKPVVNFAVRENSILMWNRFLNYWAIKYLMTYLKNRSQYLQDATRSFRRPGKTDESGGRGEGKGATARLLATRSQIAWDLSQFQLGEQLRDRRAVMLQTRLLQRRGLNCTGSARRRNCIQLSAAMGSNILTTTYKTYMTFQLFRKIVLT